MHPIKLRGSLIGIRAYQRGRCLRVSIYPRFDHMIVLAAQNSQHQAVVGYTTNVKA
jgi:hypothetical protein